MRHTKQRLKRNPTEKDRLELVRKAIASGQATKKKNREGDNAGIQENLELENREKEVLNSLGFPLSVLTRDIKKKMKRQKGGERNKKQMIFRKRKHHNPSLLTVLLSVSNGASQLSVLL